MTTFALIVTVTDTITEATQDRIERAADGTIVCHDDDGCGTMRLRLKPRVRTTQASRKAVLEAVAPLCRAARWQEMPAR